MSSLPRLSHHLGLWQQKAEEKMLARLKGNPFKALLHLPFPIPSQSTTRWTKFEATEDCSLLRHNFQKNWPDHTTPDPAIELSGLSTYRAEIILCIYGNDFWWINTTVVQSCWLKGCTSQNLLVSLKYRTASTPQGCIQRSGTTNTRVSKWIHPHCH